MATERHSRQRYVLYIYLACALLFLTALGLAWFGVYDKLRELEQVEHALSVVEQETMILQEKLKRETDKGDEALQSVAEQLPTTPELAPLLYSLEAWEKESGLTLESLNFTTRTIEAEDRFFPQTQRNATYSLSDIDHSGENGLQEGDGQGKTAELSFSALEVGLSFSGPLSSLEQFMVQILESPRLIHIDYLTYNVFSGEGGQEQVEGTMVIQAYYGDG